MKTRRQKTTRVKRREAPAAARRLPRKRQLDQGTSELAEARKHLAEVLEQQNATSEVLKIISSSRGELRPVFNAILENAARLCDARFGNVFIYERHTFQMIAQHNPPPAYVEWVEGRWSWDRVHPDSRAVAMSV